MERMGPMPSDLIDAGKELGFVAEAAHEVAQKMPLVAAVDWLVKGVSAGGEIDGRAYGGYGGKRCAARPTRRRA